MEYSVVHSMHVWLSQTMTWLYTQVRCLPPAIRSFVVAETIANLDQFPFDNLIDLSDDSRMWSAIARRSWTVTRRRHSYRLRSTIRDEAASILHSHFGDRGWRNINDAERTGVKHVVSFYGYDVSRLPTVEPRWRSRYLELFASADLLLCEGSHLGRCLQELGCPAHKIEIHHLGIDTDVVPFRPRRWHQGRPLRVLLAGAFTEKKGMPYAIEALGHIKDRVELEVTIVGDAPAVDRHQREKARIHDAIARAGLQHRVKLLGMLPYEQLLRLAQENDIFLSPSVTGSDGDTEGGAPVSIIEMAASGMPVISTRHCDIPEVLTDGVGGLLADERDVEGLVRHLYWLTDHPEAWEAMAVAARTRIEEEFCSAKQGRRLAARYDRLAAATH